MDTTDSSGDVSRASEALAVRLRDAGFPPADISVLGPRATKKNLVVRFRGTGRRRPVLFLGHLDVVEAPRTAWDTDPFRLVEKDGYFYGRGTQDLKSTDAIAVATLIRLRKENFVAQRDVILALTAGQESFRDNGAKWLLEQRRDLVDAEFVINMDGAGVMLVDGKPVAIRVDAAEKLYADFRLSVSSRGGTAALPVPGNAIYTLTNGLARLERHQFGFELNPVIRAYLTQIAETAAEPRATYLRGLLKLPPDADAVSQTSRDPVDNALLHTVCAPTRLDAGHANNALPQVATATVNCRILPGHSAEETRQILVRTLMDSRIRISYVREFDGRVFDRAPDTAATGAAAPLRQVLKPLERAAAAIWPGVPVIAGMSFGESDAVWTAAAGMPTYAVSVLAVDQDDIRSHGANERLRVESFDRACTFFYEYVKALASSSDNLTNQPDAADIRDVEKAVTYPRP